MIEDAHKDDLTDRKALMRLNRLLGMQERQSNVMAGLATRATYQSKQIHGHLSGHPGQRQHHGSKALGRLGD